MDHFQINEVSIFSRNAISQHRAASRRGEAGIRYYKDVGWGKETKFHQDCVSWIDNARTDDGLFTPFAYLKTRRDLV